MIQNVLSFLLGLALFLFGMNEMGRGLTAVSGGKLEKILAKLTSTPIRGVLLGAGVTAIIQSSSATTVMVVGFVNSGIMQLRQAVGVIMGANIGTTMTSWILSLTGIEGDNLFLTLCKPTSFSPVLAVIGVVLVMFSKREKRHHIGMILIGFAVLMTGMSTMSGAVEPLKDVPEFTHMLTLFSNPFLGVLAGTLLTAIIQSSSASIGILQALCSTGAITYGTALPIIMGQNIGTCVTALLSAVGASKNARRAAFVHLYFNLIGTVVFMVAIYTAHAFFPFAFFEEQAGEVGIAIIHSIFNVVSTLMLLPFNRLLEKLACLTVPDHVSEDSLNDLRELDVRFLDKPALALEQSEKAVYRMADLTRTALGKSFSLFDHYDAGEAEQVDLMETKADHFEDRLGSYLVQLSRMPLSEEASRRVSVLLHDIGDFERITDYAKALAASATEMHEKQIHFSDFARQEVLNLMKEVQHLADGLVNEMKGKNLEEAQELNLCRARVTQLCEEARSNHIERLKNGECTIEMGFILTDVCTNLRRTADHCVNVINCQFEIYERDLGEHRLPGAHTAVIS